MKKLSIIFGVALLATFLTANLFAQDVKFSIPLPLTGTNAKFGEIEKKSYEIAMEEINAKGGIKGKKVVLEFEDSQGKPEVSRSIAEKLIDVKKQPVVFGEYSSSCSKAIAAVAEERKDPYLVVTGATDDITQQNYKYVFRMNPTNAYYASGLMSFLKEVVKPTSIAILYESSDFGTSGAEDMVKQAEKFPMKVLVKEQYEKGAVDFKPILSKVKAAEARCDLHGFLCDGCRFADDGRSKNSGLMQNSMRVARQVLLFPNLSRVPRRHRNTSSQPPSGAHRLFTRERRSLLKSIRSVYKDYPSYHGAEAYSALYIIKDVLTRAKSWTPDDIRVAMKATNMMTAFGPIKFEDKEGYTNQNFMDTLVLQVINGQFETIWPQKYASTKYVYPIPRWRDRK